MPANEETRNNRVGYVAEAAEMLRKNYRPAHVRVKLCKKYPDMKPDTAYRYVLAAADEVGLERARKLNARRCLAVNEIISTMTFLQKCAQRAAKLDDLATTASLLKTWNGSMGLKLRAEHLDRISPMLGLEDHVTREQLIEALLGSMDLLSDRQREQLREALDEVVDEDDDDSLTTTLEAR